MLKRLLTTLFVVVGVAGFAQLASAQYMYLDSNANGIHDSGDVMQANGTPTPVDVYVNTNHNRDGSLASCDTGSEPLSINSYVVEMAAVNGTVTYAGFINQQAGFTFGFGEVNTGNSQYKNGFGQQTPIAPGTYKLMSITVTGTGGTPALNIVDLIPGTADITSFGSNCFGNDFDNTYKLAGASGLGTDWTDADGLGAAAGAVNHPPVLTDPGNRTVNELSPLTFTLSATDPDAGQTITYSMDAGSPAGATINGSTGAFAWTPTEAQGPGSFPVTFRATDNGAPPANAARPITITVNEVNVAPVVTNPGNKVTNELAPLTFTVTATDADLPANTIAWSLDAGAPAGATIGAGTGAFAWTPTEAQGPGTFPVTIRATDNGSPVLSGTAAITITVNEVNVAPVLNAIGPKSVTLPATLTFTATATDADVPANTLAFSLDAGAPAGATIGAGTGAFSWTPAAAGTFPVTVRVTDNGSPALSAFEVVSITVSAAANQPPVVTSPGNKTVAELANLAFTVVATDPNSGQILTYSLDAGAPAGATINGSTGAFSWTPTEAQGPGSFPITIRATDNGSPALSGTAAITVSVTEVNVAPVVTSPGNRTIAELANLAFTVTATDADLPANTIAWSLTGAPAGATIGAGTGAFSWTPTEAQGPGSFPVTINATDNGSPALAGTAAITITVTEVNVAPVVTSPGNRTIAELANLAFTVTATDADVPANTLTWSLDAGAPAGATIGSANGAFSWTPTEAQGPGSFPVTIRATDNGTPALSGTAAITITVTEVNAAPVLNTIGNKTGTVGVAVAFTATATDSDVPANTLTFSLEAGAPAGSTINGSTGAFSWTPAAAGTFPVTVRVTDNGSPALFDNEAISIVVSAAPNQPPVVTNPGNKTVNELSPLTFTVTATDPNSGDVLTFSLDAGAPAGATIGGANGAFSWTPTEAQGPGTFPITIRATDNGSPVMSGSAAITVTVNEVNVAPVVTNPGNKTTAELANLAFTVTATDADLPANTIAWSLTGAPAGATIGASTGAFSWTPTEAQGPGSFPLTITATDNGSPALAGTAAITITVTEVNVAPVLAAIGNKTVNELATLTFTATATDADLPANTLTFSLDAGAPAGATIGASTGAFSWTPTEAQGPASTPITVRVTDNGSPALSASELITVTVNEINVAPVVTSPGNKTIAELANLAFTVTATDADAPANTISWSLTGAPAGATIGAGTGAFSWTPTEAQGPGSFPVTITATDNGTPALAGTAAITITVTEVNAAPVLNTIGNKAGTVGVAITFTATATDSDVPANTLTFSLEAGAPAGSTINGSTGAFSWTPAANGTFPVTVRVTDNGSPALFDNEAISITVSAAPNQAPTVTNPGNKTVNELSPLTFTVTATDPNAGDVLTFSLDAGAPAGATIGGANGAFSWTPTEAQGPGTFPITIRATDNGTPVLSGSAAITVTVNEVNVAPVVTNPGNKTTAELANLAFTVTATDADLPANTITWTLDAGAPAGATIGASTGAFSWTPAEIQGPGSFPVTIRATDNGSPSLSGTAAITITVTEVNVAPVLAAIGNKTVNELATLTFTATATDADLPANGLSFSLDAGAPAGASINAGTGAFSWTPTEAQGPASTPITVRVTDNGSPALSASELITVTVNEINVAPVVTSPGNKTIAELANLAFTVTATDADVPANTIAWSLTGAPAGATIGAGTGAFSWTPTEAQGPGSYPVTITATDNGTPALNGTAAITITVTEVNVAPVLNPIGNKAGTAGVAVTFTATATDSDVPANTLTFSLEAGAPAGATINGSTGAFSWTPSASGTFPVTVRVTDNGSPALFDNEAISIVIGAAPNNPPVVTNPGNKTVNELSPLTFTVTATDPDAGQTLAFSLDAGAPAGATIGGANGAFSWTPTEAQGPGTFPITIRATDNGTPVLSGSAAITVTVNEVNVAPVVTNPGNKTTAELANLAFTVTATDADLPANTITWTLDAGAPAGATIGASTGAFSWTPAEIQGPGSFPVTIRATDNGSPSLSGTAAITITVTEANVAPVLAAIGNKTVNELATLTFTATATDADLPANGLSFSLDAGAPAGASINAGTGAFSWTPTEAQGPASTPITVRVTDNGSPALSASELITVTVNEINVAPVVTSPGNKTIAELANLAFTVTATDADVPANTIAWSLTGAPAGATIGAGTGAFSWTPTEAQGPGSYPVTITATDNGTPALNGTAAITITVTEVNVAPVLAAIGNKSGTVSVPVTFTASATDADIPANALSFSLDAGAPAGATINASTGAFSFTSAAAGSFPVTVRVTDNGTPALSSSEAITITIGAAANQAPVLGAIGNKTVAELSTLAFTATATDPNSGDVLTFSLDSPTPAGATINASTGAFSWTPTEAQGPAAIPITVRVTDNGSPALSDFETIAVAITEVNQAPVLAPIGNKTVNEMSALTFTATATDADVPANTLTFSLDAPAPAGATINGSTGAFSWTPTEAQGPAVIPITVRVTDSGSPALSAFESIAVAILEVNQAPVLGTITNKTVTQGSLLAFTVTATDADIPANTLAFSLDAGAPAGATINASTGAFSWTPPAAGSFSITARVTDNGTPALSASQAFTVTVNGVNSAPVLTQPSNMTVNEGATADQTLTATDPDAGDVLTFSKVSGPAFMTVSAAGVVHLAPGSTDAGSYTASVKVSDNGSPSLSDTKSFSITVNDANRAPVANAGGPYTGSVGTAISFNGSGSSDPDGDALTYAWTFGDASTGSGVTPSHAYAATGTYTVSLTVTDPGLLTGTASTTATISDFFAANVFFKKNINYILPQLLGAYIRFEPVGNSFNVNDVILSSSAIRLTYNGITKNANCKNILDGDSNANGKNEIRACFTQADMKAMFTSLPNGTTDVTLTLEADLSTGGKVRGTVVAHIVKFSFLHAGQLSMVSPNPLNPQAKLSFVVTKPGVTTVQVFDVNGRLVRNLMQRQYLMPGMHDVTVDGRNESGNKLSSGVYYYRVQTADVVTKGSFIVMK